MTKPSAPDPDRWTHPQDRPEYEQEHPLDNMAEDDDYQDQRRRQPYVGQGGDWFEQAVLADLAERKAANDDPST